MLQRTIGTGVIVGPGGNADTINPTIGRIKKCNTWLFFILGLIVGGGLAFLLFCSVMSGAKSDKSKMEE